MAIGLYTPVSVPFTSGSSLQRSPPSQLHIPLSSFQFPLHRDPRCNRIATVLTSQSIRFQFPLHRDPRCNQVASLDRGVPAEFQFPLHRDPRCNMGMPKHMEEDSKFQFPLHRDPRCNIRPLLSIFSLSEVSVPFTSGSSLQPKVTRSH